MLVRSNDPFQSLSREMSRLFNPPAPHRQQAHRDRTPTLAADMWADESALHVRVDLPGITMKDIEVLATVDDLRIKAARPNQRDENARVLRAERPSGDFDRTIPLPFEVDIDNVHASLNDGVLAIRLPKAATRGPRRIDITSN